MAREFEGQVVWITGGGSGIGRACALRFAEQGAKVAVSGRRREPLDAVVATIAAKGGEALAVPCDVTDDADVKRAVADVLARFGRLDVAFANAGYGVGGQLAELDAATFARQFEVNVFGLMNTVRHAVPPLAAAKGRLVLTSSVAAYVGTPGSGAYAASKFAVRGLGETLWAELAGKGITCTTIYPGFVESEIAQVDNQGRFHPEWQDRRPSKLMWTAEAAARAILPAIRKRRRAFVFTWHGKFAVWAARACPGFMAWIMKQTALRGKSRPAKHAPPG